MLSYSGFMASWFALIATVVLLGAFASRHLGARGPLLAIGLFATMPIVWLAARGAATQVVLLPALMAWLFTLDAFLRSGRSLWLVATGASTAAMLYLHLAGWVLAPLYLGIAATAIAVSKRQAVFAALAALGAGMVLVALPFSILLLRDLAPFTSAINSFGLYDANRFNPLQGAREIASWVGLTVRSEVYWDSFNPALWFLGKGGGLKSLVTSPVFLAPLVVPFARGAWAYIIAPTDSADFLVFGGLLAAPAAIALIAQPPVPARLIVVAPFVALVAARGCYPGAFRTTDAGVPAPSATVATTR